MSRRTELAWAAGFFDGEGTTYLARQRGRGGRYAALYTTLPQNDRRPVERFRAAVGVGRITTMNPRPSNKLSQNVAYRFEATNFEACEVLRLLSPYLSAMKLEQAARAIADWKDVRSRFTHHRKTHRKQKTLTGN